MPEKIYHELPIRWNIPEGIVARYATNIVVQHTNDEFILSFFEIKPPILLGEPEEIAEQLKDLQAVNATCVAQVIVAKNRMADFIKALENNFNRGINNSEEAQEE
ncbi:MAG: hypothetical protein HPY76_13315 [Anaerolineae bacterium]|jgi:hypothetical protein|nr:hypothetical protein [Anaerolineae bacterium]